MSNINLLDENTINKIAAGEVVERPSAVVKELVENSLDAGANAITVETKDGGLSMIRITDNGKGVNKDDIPLAFLRHATSKIKIATDLLSVNSLGFRGEALSSIAAVSQIELITKEVSALTGVRYIIEGGAEQSIEEIGCPTGTTIIIRNLFYNTPARRNFLKSPGTESSLIGELMERLMISHPNVSFKYITNNKVVLQSSGNNNTKDIIYQVFGRDIAREILPIDYKTDLFNVNGYIGKPSINRGNRNYEIYFINGRFIKSNLINKAIEDAYKPYLMQRKFPFTSLYFEINPELIDVNVHPQKLEVRLTNEEEIYRLIVEIISNTLSKKEMIPSINLTKEKTVTPKIKKEDSLPEPFETNRLNKDIYTDNIGEQLTVFKEDSLNNQISLYEATLSNDEELIKKDDNKAPFISIEAFHGHRIIGQVFSTYWLVEYNNEVFYIDQHAAHEKILYERIIRSSREKNVESQMLFPPLIITIGQKEQETIKKYKHVLEEIGYEIEEFGGNEYSIRAIPAGLFALSKEELLKEFIDDLTEETSRGTPELILEKIASMSCKAAIKANMSFSYDEAKSLIKELLSLENPYYCPHGRPIIISMTKYELEKKFKRIL